ncbi:MAG: Fic family protein [Firmicutes bacterium]|nr:Fic family protein [Bacillota bacterium]
MDSHLRELRAGLHEILKGRPMLDKAIHQVNRINMIKGTLIARSENHRDIPVSEILEGRLDTGVSLGDYTYMEKAKELVKKLYGSLSMGNSVDRNFLLNCSRVLTENPEAYFRKDNPVIYTFNHVPPHRSDVEENLAALIRKVYEGNTDNNPVFRAMLLHNGIINIWPFEEYSAEIALFAMNYFLMEKGFIPVTFDMPRKEYLEVVSDNLKGRREKEFYYTLREAVTDTLEEAVDACAGYRG